MWREFLELFRKKHPSLSLKDAMEQAKEPYHRLKQYYSQNGGSGKGSASAASSSDQISEQIEELHNRVAVNSHNVITRGKQHSDKLEDIHQEILKLSKEDRDRIIELSSSATQVEWITSFQPIIQRLESGLLKKVNQLVTEKLLLEEELGRRDSGSCPEFDFEKEFEKCYKFSTFDMSKRIGYGGKDLKLNFGFADRTPQVWYIKPLKQSLNDNISMIQKRGEKIVTFYVVGTYSSGSNFNHEIYIITQSHIYLITASGGMSPNPYHNIKLLYKFDTNLSPANCKLFINYCSVSEYIQIGQTGSPDGNKQGTLYYHFILLFTSIPGTLYPTIVPYWNWIETPADEPQRYIHIHTGEITDSPPYETAPVHYD